MDVRVTADELMLLRRPVWPATRPRVPSMCCSNCLRLGVCWIWRFVRVLHLLVLESYEDADPCDADTPGSGSQVGAWPWRVPDALVSRADFLAAAAASRAVAEYCDDALVLMSERLRHVTDDGDRRLTAEVCRHVKQTLAICVALGQRFARTTWDRQSALDMADNCVHRMTELFIAWPRE